jgi:hypothetical protein
MKEFHCMFIITILKHLTEDGSINPMAQMMVTQKWNLAEQSDLLIQQRLSGYRKHVEAGGKVGRIVV